MVRLGVHRLLEVELLCVAALHCSRYGDAGLILRHTDTVQKGLHAEPNSLSSSPGEQSVDD